MRAILQTIAQNLSVLAGVKNNILKELIEIYLVEETYLSNPDGSLTIPADKMAAMGINRQSDIIVAFLADDEDRNLFHEFLLSPTSNHASAEQSLFIPSHLLEQARFEPQSDLNIACTVGAVVIYANDELNTSELYELLDALSVASDFLRDYDDL